MKIGNERKSKEVRWQWVESRKNGITVIWNNTIIKGTKGNREALENFILKVAKNFLRSTKFDKSSILYLPTSAAIYKHIESHKKSILFSKVIKQLYFNKKNILPRKIK